MWGLVIGIAAWAQPGESRAQGSLTVNAGYDLFTTVTGTDFPGLGPLVGVQLGTFDFGSGSMFVGNADTIVHRLDDVTVAAVGDTGTTRLEMLALQLETAAPVDFAGNGLDNYFVTLQSARGGPATTGSMDITFLSTQGGTFSSFFDVFFDIRKGSLNGTIVLSDELTPLANQGADWGRVPPPGAILINGVNYLLDGTDTDKDFWPGVPPGGGPAGIVKEVHPNGANHWVTTSTPEPSTWIMFVTAGLMVPAYARWRRRRA